MGDPGNLIKHLPLHIIAKLDSLANVEFHKLTKKILKDRIEEIKIAVAKELAKRSSLSNANGDIRENAPCRPNPVQESDEPLNNSQAKLKKPLINDKSNDKNTPQSRSTVSTSAKSSSVGLKKCPPPRPSFNELLKLADKPRETNRQSSERSVNQRSLSPTPQKGESTSKGSTSHFSRPLSPVNRGRSKVDIPPPKSNGVPRSTSNIKQPISNASSRQSNGNNRPPINDDARYNGKSESRANGLTREESRVPRDDPRGQRDDSRGQRDDPRGQRISEKDEKVAPKSNKKEPVKSARVKRKDEELRILEEKKRRLREEEERIKLRNQVLAGQVHRTNDLKTLVTKSHGSTLLSCGSGGSGNYDDRSPPYDRQSNVRASIDDRRVRESRGSRDDSVEHRNGMIRNRMKDNRSISDQRDIVRERMINRDSRNTNNARRDNRARPMHINPYMDESIIPRSNMKRSSRYDDYDDEEDDDMDDFIDDDEGETTDVTPYIKEIFGYDKRRYIDDDDDDIQEASYHEIEKEERRSAKLGRQEDAEAERLEKLHHEQKRQRMMSRR